MPANSRFAAFVLVGGIAAVINFCSRILLNLVMPFAVAIVFAYLIGMVTAFILNRRFVFGDAATSVQAQAWRFTVVNAAAVLLTLGISLLLNNFILPWMGATWHPREISHAIGVAAPIISSYLGHRHWTFARHS